MKFLVDNALSPVLSELLQRAGCAAVHLREVMDPSAPDEAVLDFAERAGYCIISADSDFGTILANRLNSGYVISISAERIRIRRLPLR